MHTGYFLRGFLGLHAFLFTVVNLGLFVIDSTYTNTSWFYWPVLGWGIVLGVHVYAVFGYTRIESPGVLVTQVVPPPDSPEQIRRRPRCRTGARYGRHRPHRQATSQPRSPSTLPCAWSKWRALPWT